MANLFLSNPGPSSSTSLGHVALFHPILIRRSKMGTVTSLSRGFPRARGYTTPRASGLGLPRTAALTILTVGLAPTRTLSTADR